MSERTPHSSPGRSGRSIGRERRGEPRHPCRQAACCYSLTTKQLERYWAWIRDVSLRGVGLLLSRKFEPDTLLIIEVRSTQRRLLLPLTARVVHSSRQPEGDWLIGCLFTRELNSEELHALTSYS
jgi:hypothetical protein